MSEIYDRFESIANSKSIPNPYPNTYSSKADNQILDFSGSIAKSKTLISSDHYPNPRPLWVVSRIHDLFGSMFMFISIWNPRIQ